MQRTNLLPGCHPLDEDIASLVDGLLDQGAANDIEAHLAQCMFCRIKRQRFAGQPPMVPFSDDVVVPEFHLIKARDERGEGAQAGELWVTKGPDSIMVLVRSVDERTAIVVPVVIDVELADDECQVVPAGLSPLSVAIAVYSRLRGSVPVDALCKKIVPDRELDLMNLADVEGVFTGQPIEGLADPRLEVRQWLTDRLTMLTPHQIEQSPLGGDHSFETSEMLIG